MARFSEELRGQLERGARLKAQEVVARGGTVVGIGDYEVAIDRYTELFGVDQKTAKAMVDYQIKVANREIEQMRKALDEGN